jgi:hypothetical protein
MNIVDAFDDPALFEPWFRGPSWDGWRAILKAAFAIPITALERDFFRTVAQRDPPRRRVREIWIAAGRRSGKDSVASAINTWFVAFENYEERLRPGELASVISLAVDRPQAKLQLRYARAYFERIGMLAGLVTRETADGLEFSNAAELTILANSFRSVRGRSIACATLGECAFWRDETSASPDTETYTALIPGLATLPGSMLVGISSPYRRAGLLYEKWRDHFGKDDDDVLVIQAASRVLNPSLPEKVVADALARDPAAARAEWLAEWRDDIAAYLSRELIEAAVDVGVVVRPPVPSVRYKAFADPSGGVNDSFCLGISHVENDTVLVDCLLEIISPFNPTEATADVASTLRQYDLRNVVGDRYAAGWVVDAFRRAGVEYKHSDIDRSAIYANALPLFTSGRVRLLDNRKLVTQFATLERRASSAGKDRIGHPEVAGAHDDLSNACAGALVLSSGVIRDPNTFDMVFSNGRTLKGKGETSND